MSRVIAGFIGKTDTVDIPARSLSRIMRTIFDLDEAQSEFDRHVAFRAIRDAADVNVSEVIISTVTLNGRQTDQEARIVYRNGLFRTATVSQHGDEYVLERLSDVLTHLTSGPR